MSDPAESYAIAVSPSGVPDPKLIHAFNRGRAAGNQVRTSGAILPVGMSAAENDAWLAGFQHQVATWSAPLPPNDDSEGGG